MKLLSISCWLVGVGWAAAVLWFDGLSSRALSGALTADFGLASLLLFVAVRPAWRALLGTISGSASAGRVPCV